MRVALAALALCACGPAYFTGSPDVARTERGEIYVDTIRHGDTFLVRGVEALDVPAWRAWNLFTDVEGVPEWDTLIESTKVVRRDGRTVDAVFMPRSILLHDLEPIFERLSFVPEKLQVSLVGFENSWLRDLQLVARIEPLPGDRSLATMYFTIDMKPWWSPFAVRSSRAEVARTLDNVRHAVLLPRYAKRQPELVGERVEKVAVPRFRADGVSSELARAATRALAEGLMRAHWSVITQEEAVALLDYAKQQQLAGCSGESGCELDLARALDAGRLVHGAVSHVGDAFVYSASLLELPEGRVVRRVGGQAADESALLNAVRGAAVELSAP